MMRRLSAVFGVLLFGVSCGLLDDSGDEEERLAHVVLPDPVFEHICLAAGDSDGDGRLSRYEARTIRSLDCRGAGIGSMQGVGALSGLVSLDCGGNPLELLDLSGCAELEILVCDSCGLDRLDVSELPRLRELRCGGNGLSELTLADNRLLAVLDCRGNRLVSLAVEECARSMTLLWTRGNPDLTYIYLGVGQQVADLRVDGGTQVVSL